MYKIVYTTVFAAAVGGGNPCPVVLDADSLSTEEMQRMTEGFRYESVFVQSSEQEGCDFKLRYFVPLHEMEMCVHATIAATTILVREGRLRERAVGFETRLGNIRVEWEPQGEQIAVQVWQLSPKKLPDAPTVEEVCQALRITEGELLNDSIQSYSTSRYKLLIPLKSRETLDHLTPDFSRLRDLCGQYQTTGFYPFAMEKIASGIRFYARQFPQNSGYPEDAATGVAASALGVYLLENHILPAESGWNEQEIYQGQAMGRPSFIRSRILVRDGGIQAATVCGVATVTGPDYQ